MGGEGHILKRIACIKFLQRHPKSSTSGSNSSQAQHESAGSDVPAPPNKTAAGRKTSLQPERTPVLPKEIEAILLGKFQLDAFEFDDGGESRENNNVGVEFGCRER